MYQIQYNIPYEGYTIEYFHTFEEVQEWVRKEKEMSYKPWYDYEVYLVEKINVQDW